ncbi:MAG: polysaccharide lyase 11 [Anaerolineae bacterium]|nr:polysaccharide lyase 11 [Anaerolineae bacterium]
MASSARTIALDVLLELNLGSPIGQCRAMPVALGPSGPSAILVVYGADFDVDPYVEMFFFPSDTLKMALLTPEGGILWRRDLGPGVVPGIWFCPVFAFDLDGDGVDEIWYVSNVNRDHPLGLSGYRLERLDGLTGQTTGQWPWPYATEPRQSLSHTFRNFILGGHAHDRPVLVTAQGTYGDMFLQGWATDLAPIWQVHIRADEPGARGSHMCALVDLDDDGVQEILWGERCIALDDGRELFCADRASYGGHSDIVQPVLDRASGHWAIYTCREGDGQASPRVALYDAHGRRRWGDVEYGHMDMGWVAHLGLEGDPVAMAIRIGHKTCGPDGRFHQDRDEFVYAALTGQPLELPFGVYGTLPVDLNGDGYHELVRGLPGQDGAVLTRQGEIVGRVGGTVAMLSRFMDRPGEQLLAFYPDGTLRVWADRYAADSATARARYEHPLYRANQRLTGVGYNLVNLGGI